MKKTAQDYIYNSVVSDSNDVNEFIIEFLSGETSEGSPVKVTRNFEELIQFFEEIED
ncbi:hypothetical protein ACFPA1_05995 [Neobacillus sp. GCM10023253]|uniref:hypothetical protein n=1 Tax=Neobacillus sp. GCM10023253 TaxID=3252644 RepID=UPI0036060309